MNLILPKGDDGIIQRANMPQIALADIPTLLTYLGSFDIGFTAGFIDPNKVEAHQAIDKDKAMGMPPSKLRIPVILSKEPFVIDGDHRWYRHMVDGTSMPFIKIEEDFKTCLNYIFSFPKTYEEKS